MSAGSMMNQSVQRQKSPQVQFRAQVPVQCPVCNWRHFWQVEIEDFDKVAGAELRQHLEAWVASRCPDHLGPILEMSKN